MGIFDNLILPEEIDVEGFPFDVSRDIEGEHRWWQTKDLNPSMDMYAILPSSEIGSGELLGQSDDTLHLCRRSPPVTKWTDANEGLILKEGEDILDDADHWRTVRYTGTLELTEAVEDGKTYNLSVEIRSGIFQSISLESSYSPFTEIYPKEQYASILDLDSEPAVVKGRNITLEELADAFYDSKDIETVSEDLNLEPEKIALCLKYYNIHQNDM